MVFKPRQPGYGEVVKNFQQENAEAAKAAMERREKGLERYKELRYRREELQTNLTEIVEEMERLVDKWGINESPESGG